MNPLRLLGRRVRRIFRKEKMDTEMSAELEAHLELQAAEFERRGMSRAEARSAAQRSFGGVEQVKEQCRDERGARWVEQFFQDLRYATRMLWKSQSFTLVAAVTLALGIGVNTALFSVVYGILLEPYPYAKSAEIWAPELRATDTSREWGWRTSDYLEMAKLPSVRSAMATNIVSSSLSGGVNPEIINTPRLTATAFDFLGVAPVLGRGFTAADFTTSGEAQPVVVLSFRFWQRMFEGKPDVLGRTLVLDDQTYTVIGVMPPRFTWYGGELWLPLATTDLQRGGVRPIVRLQPGVTREVASDQLLALVRAQAERDPAPYPKNGYSARFQNYLDVTVASGEMRASLIMLMWAVAFLLLIACTNVANLQLARGAVRAREMAVRLALGASRGRLVRQLLTESVVLSVIGGALGVVFAFWLTRVIVTLMPDYYVPSEAEVSMNRWVLLFSAGVSVLTGVVFGLIPGLQSTRPDVNDALKVGDRGAAGTGRRTRNTLAVVEISLAVILLVGAGVAIQGFIAMQRVDRGFKTERLVMLSVPLSAKRYTTLEQRNGFARDYLERLRALSGVEHATLGAMPDFEAGSGVAIAGQPKIQENVGLNYIDTDYFATLGIPLREGRNFSAQEILHGDRVALVSERAAKLWADGKSPLGRIISVDSLVGGGTANIARPGATKEVTVIGVVADVHSGDRRRPPSPVIFVPYTLRGPLYRPFLARTRGEASMLVNAMRAELRSLDPAQSMRQPRVVEDYLEQQAMQPRFNLVLFASLASIALGLAGVGIYSVLGYNVVQRTREFGVRLALGADRRDILALVLGDGGRVVGTGLIIGLAVSMGLVQFARSKVPDVPLPGPLTLAASTLVLIAAATLACWWPARRATKVDPVIALRAE